MSYSSRGAEGNKGTVSYLLEDSWPRLYIVLGWTLQAGQLQVLLSIADKHLRYEDLLKIELNSLVIKVSKPLEEKNPVLLPLCLSAKTQFVAGTIIRF